MYVYVYVYEVRGTRYEVRGRYLIHVRLRGIAYYHDGEANRKSWNKYIIAIVIIRCNDVESYNLFAS